MQGGEDAVLRHTSSGLLSHIDEPPLLGNCVGNEIQTDGCVDWAGVSEEPEKQNLTGA